jgi:hydroxyacylglutathione hydrolase
MQVSQHVHALKIPFTIPLSPTLVVNRFVYVYLIFGKRITLIDAGVAGTERTIFEYLEGNGRQPSEIATLVLTHAHPDHIGAARAIKDATGCTVVAHRAEQGWIEDVARQARERPVPGFDRLVGGPVGVDRLVTDGEEMELGGLRGRVVATPGHSPGSISLWLADDAALFCGDALPAAGEMPIYEDVLASAASIARLAAIDGIKVLCPAWRDPCCGKPAYEAIAAGRDYLRRVHEATARATAAEPPRSEAWRRRILAELGLAAMAVNPLVARSLEAHLDVLGRKIFDD